MPLCAALLDILRAVPEIVIALVLIFLLGGGPVPAMIAIALHTVGALGKLFSEVNENASLKPVEGLASVGGDWMQQMVLGVVPQVAPNYLSYALLRFEINIRASAILGFVGAGGIGYDLRNTMSWGQGKFDEAAAIFLLLFADHHHRRPVSSDLRNRLTHGTRQRQGPCCDVTLPSKPPPPVRCAANACIAWPCPLLILAYLAYVFCRFRRAGLGERINLRTCRRWCPTPTATRPTSPATTATATMKIAIEGERKGRYPEGTGPDWVTLADDTRVDLGDGSVS